MKQELIALQPKLIETGTRAVLLPTVAAVRILSILQNCLQDAPHA